MKNHFQYLKEKIGNKSAKIAVIGLGYVGLPHAIHYSEEGYSVLGIDKQISKVESLRNGLSYVDDISDSSVSNFILSNEISSGYQGIENSDIIFIDVPTPIDNSNNPDLTALASSTKSIFEKLLPGKLIILESTSYPKTTYDYLIRPLIEKGFSIGEDVFVAFSPERIDPGNRSFSIKDTPKLVGGYTTKCTEIASKIIGKTAIPVSSPEVAELAKLYENTFRFINIGLADELSKICQTLKINTREVLDAAETKPFGFMRFNPAVKIGGHCIGVDPYYLQWYMKKNSMDSDLIDTVRKIDQSMLTSCTDRIMDILVKRRIPIFDSKIAFLGVTYKKNISDTRLSVVPELLHNLEKYHASIDLFDDHVSEIKIDDGYRKVASVNYKKLSNYDLVVVLVDHDYVEYEQVLSESKAVLDTKYIFASPISEKYYCL
ncbi:nucleotide sugar dehydrogenase [Enterococcus sp. AZ196]|uniref:nucleotide sugar dehydrogenase n=1 Tax=Enterococcus sp. AZ196 TaxID=2774659 RepID=UPI003D2C3136